MYVYLCSVPLSISVVCLCVSFYRWLLLLVCMHVCVCSEHAHEATGETRRSSCCSRLPGQWGWCLHHGGTDSCQWGYAYELDHLYIEPHHSRQWGHAHELHVTRHIWTMRVLAVNQHEHTYEPTACLQSPSVHTSSRICCHVTIVQYVYSML